MAILLDTGILYAYYDRRDNWHKRSVELIRREAEGLVLPSPVIPEVDHLLGNRLGSDAQSIFYQGLAHKHFLVRDLPQEGYARVSQLNQQFADLELGFVDAAIIAMAEIFKLRHIATTDRRDFGPLSAHFGLVLRPD